MRSFTEEIGKNWFWGESWGVSGGFWSETGICEGCLHLGYLRSELTPNDSKTLIC